VPNCDVIIFVLKGFCVVLTEMKQSFYEVLHYLKFLENVSLTYLCCGFGLDGKDKIMHLKKLGFVR
jgi:hypothetical protein